MNIRTGSNSYNPLFNIFIWLIHEDHKLKQNVFAIISELNYIMLFVQKSIKRIHFES